MSGRIIMPIEKDFVSLDENKNDITSLAYNVFRLGFQRKESTGAESNTKSVDPLLQNVQQSKVEPLEPDEVEAELIIKGCY